MTNFHDDVGTLLAQVGIKEQTSDSELAPGIVAQTYSSDYARLYIANCVSESPRDWSDLVRRVDRKVLQDVRAAELRDGGVIDAHVCFVVGEEEDPTPWIHRNEDLVRHVSRKYWIKNSKMHDEFENRLTLLPITNAPVLQHTDQLNLSQGDRVWLDLLLEEGPTTLFAEFSSRLEIS